MSSEEANPDTNQVSAEQKDSGDIGNLREGKRRTLQSGFSLLARGEPQIWLIGGMLVVCLAMIASLLSLILYNGLPSFWPRSVHWLVLTDGTMEIGQPQSRTTGDSKIPEASTSLETTDGPSSDEAVQLGSTVKFNSYYRTGNYRLSGVHYRWMDSNLLTDDGIVAPPSAVVVERLEWGRFYGIPVQCTELIELPADVRERLKYLTAAAEALDASGRESIDSESFDAESLDTNSSSVDFPASAEALRQKAVSLRREALTAATQATQSKLESTQRIQVQPEANGSWTLQDEATSPFEAARIATSGSEEVAERLRGLIPVVLAARRQRDALQIQVSRLDSQISEFRVDIRRAELETGRAAVHTPDAMHFLIEQRVATQRQIGLLRDASDLLDVIDEGQREELRQSIALAHDVVLPMKIERLDRELEQWLGLSDELPKEIQLALRQYKDGYQRIFAEKLPLQDRIEALERTLQLAAFDFCVPNRGSRIPDVTEDELALLRTGAVDESLLQKLMANDIPVPDGSLSIQDYSDLLSMFHYRDGDGNEQVLAMGAENYSEGTSVGTLLYLPLENLAAEQIVRAVPVNTLTLTGKISVYLDRWGEFLWENPREANSEGGVFPAIWGLIVMTLIMTIAVVPFGVMAALYLREYAGAGPLVSIIRISINNLAGVPSIVYGVFGFSFFCYTVGAFIDGGAKNADITPWPPTIWYIALAAAAVVGTGAFFLSFFFSGQAGKATGRQKLVGRLAMALWLFCLAASGALIFKSPFFEGFYQAYLPLPTFGKGGVLWAALTLALLTLPVVIVATEEALAAVPNSLREGSLACGASKWQTIRRIVLPHARPGILTGAILAMARGAGEVAPLMLVGALPSAPDLPFDGEFPYFHPSRSFMHLGYQIYTLGFQSQNSDAAVPMVFTCTLLLIAIVATLNIFAIILRARLKKRFQGNQF